MQGIDKIRSAKRMGRELLPDIRLDISRACDWLFHNRKQVEIKDGLYSFLTTLWAELAWPLKDPRWESGPIAAIAYLSCEQGNGDQEENFLLRRSAPPTVPLLRLSQTRFDSGVRKALKAQSGQVRRSRSASWLRGCEQGMSQHGYKAAVVIPVRTGKRLWGALLVLERTTEHRDYLQLADALGKFLCHYFQKA